MSDIPRSAAAWPHSQALQILAKPLLLHVPLVTSTYCGGGCVGGEGGEGGGGGCEGGEGGDGGGEGGGGDGEGGEGGKGGWKCTTKDSVPEGLSSSSQGEE